MEEKPGAIAGGAPTVNQNEAKKGAGHHAPKKPDPMYLVYALIACLCFATGGAIRKFQGSNVLLANAIMTLAFLFAAVLHFLFSAIKKRANGEKYLFPWQTKENTEHYGEIVMTDKSLLLWIIIGGVLEYLGA